MAISSPGIGSNLDVNSIVTQLMQVESQPLTTLARKEASIQAKISAFGSLQGALSSFQSALSGLSDAGRLQPVLATPADTNVLGATATASAAVGSYSVDVARLAQAQSLYTAGQASTTAAIGAGGTTTLTFQFGTIVGTATNGIYAPGATFTQNGALAMGSVTIDSTNNSLEGIRDAINAANLGVTATLVSDGDETVPHHLVLTSTRTGAATSMKIGVSGDAAIAALLAHDPAGTQGMTESVAAQDATLTVNGIAVRSATNTVTGAIQGVSLSLAKVGATTVAVAQDS